MGASYSLEWKSDGENSDKFNVIKNRNDTPQYKSAYVYPNTFRKKLVPGTTRSARKEIVELPAGTYRLLKASGLSSSNSRRGVTVSLTAFDPDSGNAVRNIIPVYEGEDFGYWGSTFDINGDKDTSTFTILKNTWVRPTFSNKYTSYTTNCALTLFLWDPNQVPSPDTKRLHSVRTFWEGFNKSRSPGLDDRIEDYIASSNSFAQRMPFTTVVTDFDDTWTPPFSGAVMIFATKGGQAGIFQQFFATKGHPVGSFYGKKLGFNNVLCFSQSMRHTRLEDITEESVPNKKQRTRMQLASIVRANGTKFVPFKGEAAKLYRLLSKELQSNDDAADIRLQYTNSIITDWSVKEIRLASLSIKRGIEFETFSDDVWDEVVKTLLDEFSHVEAVRNLFLVLDDLDAKLEEQRHNDMDHCLAKMNLARSNSFSFSKPANESVFDAAGVLAIAASLTGMAGASSALGPVAAIVSNGLWLASTIAGAMEEEGPGGTFEEEYTNENFTFLDVEHLVDKSMKDAKKNQRLQIEILSDPKKLKTIAGLVTTEFRIDVGQTAILAEMTKVSNRLRFYQMLMPSKFCVRRIPPSELYAIRGVNVGTIRRSGLDDGNGQMFLSLIAATPTSGTITDGNLIKELVAERKIDTSGLGISRKDLFYRRGFWSNLKLEGVKQIMS